MHWKERYAHKLMTADQAVAKVTNGAMIRFPMAVPPLTFLGLLSSRRDQLRGITINQGIPLLPYPFANDPAWRDSIKLETDFIAPPVREGVHKFVTDFLVTEYSIGSKVTAESARRDNWRSDIFAALVSQPDESGRSYLGFSVWHSQQLLRSAKLKVAEIGPPSGGDWPFARVGGEASVSLDDFDIIIEGPPQLPRGNLSVNLSEERIEDIELIGAYVSTLVRDGDTLQIGTGTVSSSMGSYLGQRSGLGIDSEIIVPSVIELMRSGAADGLNKKTHRGKATGSLLVPAENFAFVNDNFDIELYGIEYTNNLPRISQIERMVAINQALAIDLTGQIAAESIGSQMWSGPGGQLVWTMGAMYSPGGRAITVMPSTAAHGGKRVSRIVPALAEGTLVTVPRTFVDYVVTEHGVVNLQGRTQRQRAEALISIADPEFQEQLHHAAKQIVGL